MTVVGYLIGFSFQAGLLNALACVAIVAAFGLALSWIFAFVALTVRGAEAAQSAGFVVIFPLVFASSVFVPVSTMPDWLQAFAEVSPVTLTADAARTYALDGGVPDSLAGAARLDRRPARGLHPALRLAIPADELSVEPGSMRIFACRSGSPRAANAASTPSSPTSPVISGRGSTLPSASMCSVSRNSSGV